MCDQYVINSLQSIKYKKSIYTIDPIGCKDIDDGISMTNDNKFNYVSIHITDITKFINDENINKISGFYNSIYLPDKIINMLPEVYSYEILSLKENTNRFVVTILLVYDEYFNFIKYEIIREGVRIEKNYNYDEYDKLLKKKNNFIIEKNFMKTFKLNNSHELIEYLMIKANSIVGNILYNKYKDSTILRIHKKERK